ncbi:thiol:disulfide interchange protein [Bacteroidia bacterium]|nr:thiol:disulfide interchange protein [Bacteroidia bacterium]
MYSILNTGEVIFVDSAFVESNHFTIKTKEYLDGDSFVKCDGIFRIHLILERGNINVHIDDLNIRSSKISGTYLNDLYQQCTDSSIYYAQKFEETGEQKEVIVSGTERYQIWQEYGYSLKRLAEKNITNTVGKLLFFNDIKNNAFDWALHNPDSINLEIIKKGGLEKDPRVIAYLEKKEKAKNEVHIDLKGTQYKDFELFDPSGKKYKISDFVGKSKFLLIDFWASWCGPCIRDMPGLKKLYEEYKDQGLEIISISIDEEKKDWLKAIERVNVPWKHLSNLQFKSDLTAFYNLSAIPYAVLLDKDGIIEAASNPALIKHIIPLLIKNE